MEQTLIDHLRRKHHLIVAELTAERAIREASSGQNVEVKGRDARTGRPKTLMLPNTEVQTATKGGRS
jgi:actin-like ATPase involved in cell morphogenesis